MACGCSKVKNSAANPEVFGSPTVTRKVKFTVSMLGYNVGDQAWVTGDLIDQYIAVGYLELV